MDIGKRIKLAREGTGMTQEQLAALLHCTPQHVSALERNAKQPSLETLAALASALHVSADFLLMGCSGVSLPEEFALLLEQLSPQDQLRCLCALRGFVDAANGN